MTRESDVAGRGQTLVPNWLILFLRGEDHCPGHPEVWFGDAHPTERGKFFWRRHMASAPLWGVALSHAAPTAEPDHIGGAFVPGPDAPEHFMSVWELEGDAPAGEGR